MTRNGNVASNGQRGYAHRGGGNNTGGVTRATSRYFPRDISSVTQMHGVVACMKKIRDEVDKKNSIFGVGKPVIVHHNEMTRHLSSLNSLVRQLTPEQLQSVDIQEVLRKAIKYAEHVLGDQNDILLRRAATCINKIKNDSTAVVRGKLIAKYATEYNSIRDDRREHESANAQLSDLRKYRE